MTISAEVIQATVRIVLVHQENLDLMKIYFPSSLPIAVSLTLWQVLF